MELIRKAWGLVDDPANTKYIAPLLFVFDGVLTPAIIRYVPYTEIDWKAYMQQIAQYKAGETNYKLIKGDTGPLVYPAGHVHIYSYLHTLTSEGTDIRTAQYIFAGIYLLTLAIVLKAYSRANVPPWVLPLLVLSKRLHSIYVLRCFNDGISVLFLWAAILAWTYRMWTAGAILYSGSVGVKMSGLLVLPAVAAVYLLAVGRNRAVQMGLLMLQVQYVIGHKFISKYPREYFSRAFEFTRQFLFRWTVNWRFVGEEMFLSKAFSVGLLGVHIALLGIFAATRWFEPARRPINRIYTLLTNPPTGLEERQLSIRVNPTYLLTTLLAANTIGMLCARSLHYQFYSWLAWGTPFLLWKAQPSPVLVYVTWAAQEWAWNVYPSTRASSAVVVACLAMQVLGVWAGTEPDVDEEEVKKEEERKKQ